MRNQKRLLAGLSILGCALFLVPAVVHAQTASVSGTVTDASGASVPGVTVTARNTQTNASRSTQTSDLGSYRITALVPAIYEIVFEKGGFRSLRYSNVVLTVDQSLTLDAKMEVSPVSETVEVSGQAVAPIDLDSAQISNLVDRRRITDLPLITRNPYELVLLSPGVVVNSGLGGFAVNGSNARHNNFLLDGADNNDTEVPRGQNGLTGINSDTTQEFRVITNNYLPEFGRNTGAIIDVVTKSGTNELHGTAYWFGRYDALGARDFFNHNVNTLTGVMEAKNHVVRNQFGASAGGPIWRDRTFWFVNYEGQRFRTTFTNQAIVPTAAFKTGFFTFADSATGKVETVDVRTPTSPSNRFGLVLNPFVQSLLALYPPANGAKVDDVRGIFFFPSTEQDTTDNGTVKIDHRFSDKHSLSGRYTLNHGIFNNLVPLESLPGIDGIDTFQKTQNFSLALTSIFRPNLTNDFRFGANRSNLPFNCHGLAAIDSVNSAVGGKDPFGRARDINVPGIAGFGCNVLGDANGQVRFTGTYSYRDVLSWVVGRHAMKFGGEVRFAYSNSFTDFFERSTPDFNVFSDCGRRLLNDLDPITPGIQIGSTNLQNMVAGLFGIVCSESQDQFFDKNGGRQSHNLRGIRQREIDAFVQDSWRITSHLTFDYGLRYQYNGVPWEVNDLLSNLFVPANGPGPFTFTVTDPHKAIKMFDSDLKDFEPRLGLAWDPFKKGKTSVRAGYGIFHDRVFGNLITNARGNPPFDASVFVNRLNIANATTIAAGSISLVPLPAQQTPSAAVDPFAFISPVTFDRKLRMPYSQNWNFGVQQELFGNLLVEINYVGSKGTRLLRVVDGNPPDPALVAALVAFCVPTNPANTFGCTEATLQFNTLRFGSLQGLIPFDAVHNLAFSNVFRNASISNSTYHSLQLNITKRLSHGLQIQGAYTYSHAIDDAADPLVPASGNRQLPRNSTKLSVERGNADFDVTQRLVINYIYELPFGRGRAFVKEGVIGRILEGWQVAGISTFSSGFVYDIFSNRDAQHTTLSDRAFLSGNPSIPPGSDRTQTGPPVTAFSLPPFGTGSNLSRNKFRGPGTILFDISAAKQTTITERFKLEFRTEVYNIANRPQFGRPGNALANPGTFGKSTSTRGRSDGTGSQRQIQFALKLHF